MVYFMLYLNAFFRLHYFRYFQNYSNKALQKPKAINKDYFINY